MKALWIGGEILGVTLRYWNGRPAWMLAVVVIIQAACLCGAMYSITSRLLLGGG